MDGSTILCPAALQGWSGGMIMNIVNTIMATQCALSQENVYPENIASTLEDGDIFDFIIVGAGSSGSVVSSRLSENKNWKILLVEAGGLPSINTQIPARYTTLKGTEEDWHFETEPSDAACLAMERERCRLSKGKVLGGTSSINPMMYTRGMKNDYDSWFKKGNHGWDYNSLNKFFLKSENLTATTLNSKRNYGRNGYLPVTKFNRTDNVKQIIAKAADELGYRWSDDETNSGYFDCLFTIDKGTRTNTAKAFLGHLKRHDNLYVALNTQVTRITVDPRTKTANGIEARLNNDDRIVNLKARKEVIVSAGTINSAKLLMNSGIGPRDHLEDVGVEVIRDADVGKNLKINAMFPGFLVKIDGNDERNANDDFYEYFAHRKGEMGTIGLSELVGFVGKDKNKPDVQLFHFLFRKNQSDAIDIFFKDYKKEIRSSLRDSLEKNDLILFAPILLRPKSSGRVFLRSGNPLEKPLIRAGLLEDEDDVEVFLDTIKYLDKLLKTRSFSKYNPEVVRIELPDCERYRFRSDQFWRCAVRNMATSFYSTSGTCQMGPGGDRKAVVAPDLKVNGVKRLRVVDGSMKPSPAGTGHVPSVMIGEKGADIIKRDWNYIRNNFAFVNNVWNQNTQGNGNRRNNNLNNFDLLMNQLLRYQY